MAPWNSGAKTIFRSLNYYYHHFEMQDVLIGQNSLQIILYFGRDLVDIVEV
jgi:hypothetical protein